MRKIKVAITGTGSLIGQAIIKSIKHSTLNKDIAMVGFDYFKDTIGSLWTKKNFLLPDILKKEIKVKHWLTKIINVIRLEKIDIIFPGLDFELKLFAQYKNIIETQTNCKIMVSAPDVIRIADDKYLTYKFLKESELNYPQTFLPKDIKHKRINFPCFVKPRIGFRSKDAFEVRDKKQLIYLLPKINHPVIQELIGNPNEEYTCGVICLDNDVKAAIVLRRELRDGNTETAYFSKKTPPIIYYYVYQVAEKLKPLGACNFQLRLDAKGLPKIFEINARHSGTTYMRALFGFNEVEFILSYYFRKEIKKFSLKEGVVKRYYEEIFIGS